MSWFPYGFNPPTPRPPAAAPRRHPPCRLRLEALEGRWLPSNYYVATTGLDTNPGTLDQPFATIQHALSTAAQAGDTVFVRDGTYHEKITFPRSGNAGDGPITLQAYPGEHPLLSGEGVAGQNMILLLNVNYIRVSGLEIAYDSGVTDGSGVRVLGYGANIEISNNLIHDILGHNAMGITVYGTSSTSISGLTITGNEIRNSQPSPSEALTLNGNVTDFQVANNLVHDVNNIGFDCIGGERSINPTEVCRNGLVSHNTVYNARSNYGGGYAAGIYVDGGQNVTLDGNISYQNDLGLEIGAENNGIVASGMVVSNNLIYNNDKAGLAFGGYGRIRGRVNGCTFINNTVYRNDTLGTGNGQLWIQYGADNVVADNIFWAAGNNVLLASSAGNVNNMLDYNLWNTDTGPGQAIFSWNGTRYTSFATYQARTQQDADSVFGDPQFVDPSVPDFHLTAGSPAIGAGSPDPSRYAPVDFDGVPRPQGAAPSIGAFELVSPSRPASPVVSLARTPEPERTDVPVTTVAPPVTAALHGGEPPAGSDALGLGGLAPQAISPVMASQPADSLIGDSGESLFRT